MSSNETDARNWFLRIISGVVYGPVPTQSLRAWAEQGRVQPGDEISLDQKTWQPVQSLEELDISWYLEDSNGVLTGPFNKSAAERLISEGRVGDGTSLVYKDDADLTKLVRAAERRQRNAIDDSQTEFDFAAGEQNGMHGEADLRAEIADLKLRIEELDNVRRQLIQSAEKETKVHNRQLEAERKKVAALQIEVDDLKALEDGIRASAVADAATQSEESKVKAVADAEFPLKARIAELEKQLADAPAKAEAPLVARIAELEKQLADAPAAAAEPLLKRIAALETELRTAAEATEALEAKAAAEASEPLTEQLVALQAKLEEVQAYRVDTDQAVRDATAPLLVKIDELEADKIAAVQQAASDAAMPLKSRIAELEERVARKTAEDMEALSAASDESSRLKARIVELEAERDKNHDELTEAKASLEKLQSDYSELLSFSNSRDAETLAESEKRAEEISKLRTQLEAAKAKLQQVLSTTAPNGQFAVNAATIKAERDFLTHLIEDSQKHQKLISDRLAHLADAQGETVAESIDRHERQRINIKLRNAEIDAERLTLENKRLTEKSEAREKEMQTRIRLLEVELDRVKVSALDTDNLRQRNMQLIEQLRETEQSLSLEKQSHQSDIDQFSQAQQTLVEKVEKLEAECASLPIKQEHAPAPASTDGYISASLNPTGKKFHATPWMTFKK